MFFKYMYRWYRFPYAYPRFAAHSHVVYGVVPSIKTSGGRFNVLLAPGFSPSQ